MENTDHDGGDAVERERVRHVDLLGREFADFWVERIEEEFPDLTAEGLAIILEAFAQGITDAAQVFRSRGVR